MRLPWLVRLAGRAAPARWGAPGSPARTGGTLPARRARMAEHKTKPPNHAQENQHHDAGSGRQDPAGAGPAYKPPSKRGSQGGKSDGKGGDKAKD